MTLRFIFFIRLSLVFSFLLAALCATGQTVDFTADTTGGCSPLKITLTNLSAGFSSNAEYIWDLGNGNISRLANPGVTYREEKTYTIKLTVTDGGKVYTKSMNITVFKRPRVDFSLNLNKGCVPLPVTFASKSLPGDGIIDNYFWEFGDGSVEPGGSEVQQHTYRTAQTITAALTVRNSFGCRNTLAKTAVLKVNPSPKAAFSITKNVLCSVSDTARFINASSGLGNLAYTWDFGDGKVSHEKEPSHQYAGRGNYAVKLSIISSDGCSAETAGENIINVANFHTDFDLPSLVCQNSAVLFTDKSRPLLGTRAWVVDDVKYNEQSTGFSTTFGDADRHKIQLVKNYDGCLDTATKSIKVTASPKLNGFVTDLDGACGLPATVKFKDTTATAVKWEWDFNNSQGAFRPGSFDKSPSFTFDSAGVFYTLLQVTNAAGCSARAGRSIAIGQANAVIVSSAGDSICENSTVAFSAQSEVGIKKYAWVFSDDASESNQSNPEHTFLKKGNYTVTLRYTNLNGCTGSTRFSINILEKPKFDFTASPGTTVCGNNPVRFIVSGTNKQGDYYWNFGDDSGYIYRPYNVQHRFSSDSTFSVSLVIQNSGCSDTLTKKDYITVLPPFPKISRIINTCNGTRGQVSFLETSKKAQRWVWNFGDGSASEIYNSGPPEIKHTFSASGNYRVALTVTNGSCVVSDSVNVPVLLKQNPSLLSPQTEICLADRLTVQVSGLENSSYSYSPEHYYAIKKFEFADGVSFDGTCSLDSDLSLQAGSYFYLGFVKNGDKSFRVITNSARFNCQDTTNYIHVKVKGPDAGFFIAPGGTCFKTPVTFIDTSKTDGGVPIVKWEWNYGDGKKEISGKTGPVTHKYDNPGKYPVSLIVTDQDGCSASIQADSAQVSGPKAAFRLSENPVFPGNAVTFYNESNNTGTDALTNRYIWFYGDGSYSHNGYNENPSHSFYQKGTDTVKLIAASADNTCADTSVQYLQIKNISLAFTFTTAYVYPETGCPPVIASFTSKSVNARSISWDFGDGSTASDSNLVIHTYRKPGIYRVTLYGYADNGMMDSTEAYLTVKGPYATLKADKPFACGSEAITFSTVSHNTLSYLWDFGDGTILETRDTFAVHHYLTPGVYTPFLVLKDGSGCQFTPYELTDKLVIDTLHVSMTVPPVICSGSDTRFSAELLSIAQTQLQKTLQYHWDFGTGHPADTSANETGVIAYDRAGTYPVSLKVSSPFGCTAETKAYILVSQAVKGQIKGPAAVCQGDSVSFTATADSMIADVKWRWFFPGNAVSTLQYPGTRLFNIAGKDSVILVVDNAGCADTVYHHFDVHAKPLINITPQRPTLCLGDSLQLQAHDGLTYQWENGLYINNPAIGNPVVWPPATAGYVVKVTNDYGCTSMDSVTVSVIQKLKLETDDSVYLCKGGNVRLKASGADKYHWIDGDDLNDPHVATPVTGTPVPRSYTVVGYDKYGCFSDTAVIAVKIAPLPTVDAGPDITATAGSEVQLNPAADGDVTGWSWQPSTYLSCSDCPSPKSTPYAGISYVVEVETAHHCKARDTINVHLLCKGSALKIPTAFTPNGDGLNDNFKISGDGIKLIKHLVIFGRWGQKVFEKSDASPADRSAWWNGTYQNSLLQTGTYVYMAEIICQTGESFSYKGTVTLVR